MKTVIIVVIIVVLGYLYLGSELINKTDNLVKTRSNQLEEILVEMRK